MLVKPHVVLLWLTIGSTATGLWLQIRGVGARQQSDAVQAAREDQRQHDLMWERLTNQEAELDAVVASLPPRQRATIESVDRALDAQFTADLTAAERKR